MLNKKFEEVIECAVGKEQYIKLRKTEGYRLAMRQFDESIKPAFNPSEDPDERKNHFVNFPNAGLEDDPKHSISANCYTLTQLSGPTKKPFRIPCLTNAPQWTGQP